MLERRRIFIRAADDKNQKNNAANREGLKRKGRAAEQDGEEAKDLEQTRHDVDQGDVTVKGISPRVM